MPEHSDRGESPTTAPRSRRRLLALVGTGLATSVAGCNGGDGDPETTTDPPEGAGTATETETGAPTEAETGTEAETETETETETPVTGGSQFEPDAGFASTDWLEEEDVQLLTVEEATAEAFEEAVNASGPRVVVFETSGTIDLGEQRFTVRNDELWLAGQTAPSPGITLVRGDFWIDANDCVIQHLRVRPGDAGRDPGTGWEPDTIRTGDGTQNNVVDHCSATWSVDENVSPGYDSVDTTITNSIVAEPLNDSTHHKGPHAYGMLVGNGARNVTVAGNVFAHNVSRNPRLKADTTSVVVNNVVYHFDEAINLDDSTEASVVGNAFLRVDEGDPNVEGGNVYHEDNLTRPETPMTADVVDYAGRPVWPPGLEAMPSSDVEEHNLAYAGARPADRTEHDQRIVDHVGNGDGGVVDSQEEVGGYPDLPENTHALDAPDDGLREWLERWALAVEEESVGPP